MLEHSTIEVLKKLTPKEINRLNDFIASPYYNKSQKLTLLYNNIIKYYPLFLDKNFTRKNIGIILNDNGEYNDSQLRDYLSKLLALIKKFLIIERLDTREDLKNILILNETAGRNIETLFKKYDKEIETTLKKGGIDKESYLQNYYIYGQRFNNISMNTKVRRPQQAATEISHLLQCSSNLNIYDLITQISIYVNLKIHRNKFNQIEDQDALSKIIRGLIDITSEIDLKPVDKSIVQLYASLFNAFFDTSDTGHYFFYRENFKKFQRLLNEEEVKFHYGKLISYCIFQKKLNQGTIDWNKELFEIYKQFLHKKLFISRYDKNISYNLYRDIMLNAIHYNKIPWLKEFVNNYTQYINPKFRKNMKIYALANIAFVDKQYSSTIELASKIDLDYFIYKYDVKILQLASYYENNDMLGVSDLLHAYNEALRNEKLLSDHDKSKHKNFLYYLRKLTLKNEDDLGYYFQKLLNERKIVFKRWLVDKYQVKISSLQYNISINY